jgi:hypothetical protein
VQRGALPDGRRLPDQAEDAQERSGFEELLGEVRD